MRSVPLATLMHIGSLSSWSASTVIMACARLEIEASFCAPSDMRPQAAMRSDHQMAGLLFVPATTS